MHQTLHDVVHKALGVEKELKSGGQCMNPSRLTENMTSGAHQHHTLAR
jgi:hypothetical protein